MLKEEENNIKSSKDFELSLVGKKVNIYLTTKIMLTGTLLFVDKDGLMISSLDATKSTSDAETRMVDLTNSSNGLHKTCLLIYRNALSSIQLDVRGDQLDHGQQQLHEFTIGNSFNRTGR